VTFGNLWRRLRGGRLTRRRASLSVAVGLFVGALPLYGAHFPLCVLGCVPFGLDVITAYIAANISNPLFAPFLLTAEVEVGSLVTTGHFVTFDPDRARALGIAGFAGQAAVGSLIVGATLAVLGAFIVSALSKKEAARPELDAAVRRTLARYARAPRGDRFYVSAKLTSDPVVEKLAELSAPLGEVLDVATGRGQLGLLLVELGAQRLTGFDWDERKIQVARDAAGDDADLRVGDARAVALPSADTVLLIDVLHYLPRAEQDALLARAAAAVRDGGRVVVREVDPGRGLKSRVTAWAERIGASSRYNKGQKLDFRSPDEIAAALRALGLEVRIEGASDGTPLANALIVARRQARQAAPLEATG
jgi:2-polyprenyl-3-methyl-5-hydroxy-6-metoxy-1,4-benzoquinol methylase/uncharacterized protein (DUF2062 family)